MQVHRLMIPAGTAALYVDVWMISILCFLITANHFHSPYRMKSYLLCPTLYTSTTCSPYCINSWILNPESYLLVSTLTRNHCSTSPLITWSNNVSDHHTWGRKYSNINRICNERIRSIVPTSYKVNKKLTQTLSKTTKFLDNSYTLSVVYFKI